MLCFVLLLGGAYAGKKKQAVKDDRSWWCETAYRVAHPLLDALSKGELKAKMPVEAANPEARRDYAHLVDRPCYGRTLPLRPVSRLRNSCWRKSSPNPDLRPD